MVQINLSAVEYTSPRKKFVTDVEIKVTVDSKLNA